MAKDKVDQISNTMVNKRMMKRDRVVLGRGNSPPIFLLF